MLIAAPRHFNIGAGEEMGSGTIIVSVRIGGGS